MFVKSGKDVLVDRLVVLLMFCTVMSVGARLLFASRPFLTEDAPTTPKGVVGIELGFDAKDPCGDIDAGLVVYTGVSKSAEIYLEVY